MGFSSIKNGERSRGSPDVELITKTHVHIGYFICRGYFGPQFLYYSVRFGVLSSLQKYPRNVLKTSNLTKLSRAGRASEPSVSLGGIWSGNTPRYVKPKLKFVCAQLRNGWSRPFVFVGNIKTKINHVTDFTLHQKISRCRSMSLVSFFSYKRQLCCVFKLKLNEGNINYGGLTKRGSDFRSGNKPTLNEKLNQHFS